VVVGVSQPRLCAIEEGGLARRRRRLDVFRVVGDEADRGERLLQEAGALVAEWIDNRADRKRGYGFLAFVRRPEDTVVPERFFVAAGGTRRASETGCHPGHIGEFDGVVAVARG